MEFTDLQQAIEYAQKNNQNVQRQDNKWITVNKTVIPKEKQLLDIELAIANEQNEEIKSQLKKDWKRIKKG